MLLGLGFFLTLFARSIPAYAATVLLWTLGEIAFNAVGPALVADLAPVHLRGRYNGVFGTSFGAAALVAPIIGTLTLEHLGEGWLWSGCLVASACLRAERSCSSAGGSRRGAQRCWLCDDVVSGSSPDCESVLSVGTWAEGEAVVVAAAAPSGHRGTDGAGMQRRWSPRRNEGHDQHEAVPAR